MLHLVLLQFWKKFPETVSHLAIEYLHEEKAIGLGDFDFEIVPEGKGDISRERKYKYLYVNTFILLYLQKKLVREITTGKSRMLNVSWDRRAKEADLKTRIQAEINSLPKENALHGATVHRVVVGSAVANPPKGFKTRSGLNAPTQRKVFLCSVIRRIPRACDLM